MLLWIHRKQSGKKYARIKVVLLEINYDRPTSLQTVTFCTFFLNISKSKQNCASQPVFVDFIAFFWMFKKFYHGSWLSRTCQSKDHLKALVHHETLGHHDWWNSSKKPAFEKISGLEHGCPILNFLIQPANFYLSNMCYLFGYQF